MDYKEELIKAAVEASEIAYCPYSNYKVGAALLVEGTEAKPIIVKGCNVENAAYPCGNCAEKTAIVSAVVEGYRKFDVCCVVTKDGGSPCGECREVLNEFNPKMHIILCNYEGKIVYECNLQELLPKAFGPENLLE